MLKRLALALALIPASIAGFYAFDWLLNAYRAQLLPKNFAAVTPGILYRSGQMRPEHLEQVIAEEGIRTIVCLNPGDRAEEAEIARRLGIDYVELPMPGDGRGEATLFHEYLKIVGQPERRPVLVHCAAGAYRTGVAVALYRMVFSGWTAESAMREMAYYGCAIDTDQPLIDHLRATYESIPPDIRERFTQARDREPF